MFQVKVNIEKKDYMGCNLYYLKRYVGVREIVLMIFLCILGIGMYLWLNTLWALILTAVTVVLVAAVLLFYWGTSLAGYKMEFEKRKALYWQMTFQKEDFLVETFESAEPENKCYPEKRPLVDLERVAIKKDRVYLYVNSAVMFYVRYDSEFIEGNFVEFAEYLKDTLPPEKFRMKGKRFKMFPYSRS